MASSGTLRTYSRKQKSTTFNAPKELDEIVPQDVKEITIER